ncbi:hypothetical protein Q0Z83_107570 [Actinoplanes sichuanensis]|nr:hypothetical protein Q0Z83_107570 [Actinoplanes sichuanensis]
MPLSLVVGRWVRMARMVRRGRWVALLFLGVVTGRMVRPGRWVARPCPAEVRMVRRGRRAVRRCPAVAQQVRMVRRGRWVALLFPVVVTGRMVRRERSAARPSPVVDSTGRTAEAAAGRMATAAVGPATAWAPVDQAVPVGLVVPVDQGAWARVGRVPPVVARLCRVVADRVPTVDRQWARSPVPWEPRPWEPRL